MAYIVRTTTTRQRYTRTFTFTLPTMVEEKNQILESHLVTSAECVHVPLDYYIMRVVYYT